MDLTCDIRFEPDGSDRLQPLSKRYERGRRGSPWWLAQHRECGHPRARLHHQQAVQLRSLHISECGSQTDEHEPLGTTTCLPGQPLNRRQRWRQDLPFAHFIDKGTDQNWPDVGAEGDRQQPPGQLAVDRG